MAKVEEHGTAGSDNVTAEEASAIEAGESEAIHDNAWLMFAEKPLLAIIYIYIYIYIVYICNNTPNKSILNINYRYI